MDQFTRSGPMPVEVYATSPSVIAGETIGFCVSVTDPGPAVMLEIYRTHQLAFGDAQYGTIAEALYATDYRPHISVRPGQQPIFRTSVRSVTQPIPVDASSRGCGWMVSTKWMPPVSQASGVYFAKASQGTKTSYALFVVRSHAPGTASKVLCQLSLNTYQAYNPWAGHCFYKEPISDGFVNVVSFERPCQLWDYLLYDEPIVTWLEANFSVEFCTNPDLDADASLLAPYQLLISCGHDEYWSAAMRDRVEAFAQAGGNALFLSGNTTYRPVSFDGHRMTRLADSWRDLDRPEALTTGVNWSAGRWGTTLPARGYVVSEPGHWIFDGTGLAAGDALGANSGIIGYETDAGVYDDHGVPIAPSPPNLMTLATADLDDWYDQPGNASIAAHWRQQGYVLSAATTGWGQGLRNGGDPPVVRVMYNLIGRMKLRFGIVYTVDGSNLRWYRDWNQDGTGSIGVGSTISRGGWGPFTKVFGDEAGNIYAVTLTGDFLRYRDTHRDGTGGVTGPVTLSHAQWTRIKFLFAGGDGNLYAVSNSGDLLWYRDQFKPAPDSITGGDVIGHGGWADYKFVFNGGGGIIYAVSNDGGLYWFRDRSRNGTGDVGQGALIGAGGWNAFVNVFGDSTGNLYAVDAAGTLWAYKDSARDGTGNVSTGNPIGMGGWQFLRFAFSGS